MSRACISDTSFIFYLSSQCDTKPQVFILGMESLSLINISLNNFLDPNRKGLKFEFSQPSFRYHDIF